MKTITLATRWTDQVAPTVREEYPAGWTGRVSEDRAERAAHAGVLVPAPTKAEPTE